MQLFIFLLLVLLIAACVFSFTMYRNMAMKRAREKRRNQYNDRV